MVHATATEISERLHAGKLDPVTLAEEVYERLERHGDSAIYIETTRSRAASGRTARQPAGRRSNRMEGSF